MIEIPISINKISYDPEQKGYLVTLKSLESESFLNILVGTKAAKEISLAKEGVTFPRPSTHELFIDTIDNFEIKIKKIIITEYKMSTFFAKIVLYNRNYGEIVIDAANRRLSEEMGIKTSLRKVFEFTYRAELDNNLIENEFDHVLYGVYDHDPILNKEEAEDFKWVDMETLKSDISANSDSGINCS